MCYLKVPLYRTTAALIYCQISLLTKQKVKIQCLPLLSQFRWLPLRRTSLRWALSKVYCIRIHQSLVYANLREKLNAVFLFSAMKRLLNSRLSLMLGFPSTGLDRFSLTSPTRKSLKTLSGSIAVVTNWPYSSKSVPAEPMFNGCCELMG